MHFKKIFRFFKSVKLAIVLIIIGIIISIIGTVIPQGRGFSYYHNNYPALISKLISTLKLNEIVNSPLVIILVILFFINTSICTGSRIYKRLKQKAAKRFGPDIIHIALLILIIGGFLSVSKRTENDLYLTQGETAVISKDYEIELNDIEYQSYDSGEAKNWLSKVSIYKAGELIEQFQVSVNKPFKLDKFTIYQMSYQLQHSVLLNYRESSTVVLQKGDLIDLSSGIYQYQGNKLDSNLQKAEFINYDSKLNEQKVLGVNDFLDEIQIKKVNIKEQSILKLTEDPGAGIVFFALFMLIAGLGLTLIQKMKDN